MKNDNCKYNLLDKIVISLIFISTLFSLITEGYFLIILESKPLIFSELNSFQQKIYIGIFISLVIMSISLIVAIIISEKDDDSSFKNYVFVRKEDYKALQEHSLEQEYENMKQDAEISSLKVRLSSIKLRLKILKKIFKHKKK